jgi:hypothetical protein
MRNLNMHLCVVLHILVYSGIFIAYLICIWDAYLIYLWCTQMHVYGMFLEYTSYLHFLCILHAYSSLPSSFSHDTSHLCIWLRNLCIWVAYTCIFIAYLLHIYCILCECFVHIHFIFCAYDCIKLALLKVHIQHISLAYVLHYICIIYAWYACIMHIYCIFMAFTRSPDS